MKNEYLCNFNNLQIKHFDVRNGICVFYYNKMIIAISGKKCRRISESKIIKRDFYVSDLIIERSSVMELRQRKKEIMEIFCNQ